MGEARAGAAAGRDGVPVATGNGRRGGTAALAVRRAAASDVAAVVELVESAYRGDASRAGWTTEADLLDGQRTDAGEIAALLDAQAAGEAALLLVTDPAGRGSDQLLACCLVRRQGEGAAYFGMFAVSPTRQGSGIGRFLLEAAERHALGELGATRLRMQVIRQREELIAWYGRLGYAPTGETEPFPYGDARFGLPRRDDLEFIVLERSLQSPRPGPASL